MGSRRTNGEGTIYKRKDGRWTGVAYLLTLAGATKRVQVYGKTRKEIHDKLTELQATAQKGLPAANRKVKVAEYMDYFLKEFVKVNKRPHTYSGYELNARLYIKPGLGDKVLSDLTVPMVQAFLNNLLKQNPGKERTVQAVRTTLSAALTRAMREELVFRNVARVVEPPQYTSEEVIPWTTAEANTFLEASQAHTLAAAFQLLVLLGLRKGEVLGLRWRDIDFERGEIRIRQQLQRIGGMGLVIGPVKTDSGVRDLPMLGVLRTSLLAHQATQTERREVLADRWRGDEDDAELVFTTSVGTPIEPDNFSRTFHWICAKRDIRFIKVHHVRHSLCTRLKELGVPLKDAQGIMGHANVATTMAIYQHEDMESRTKALEKVEGLFEGVLNRDNETELSTENKKDTRWCQNWCQRLPPVEMITMILSGGPGGTRTHDILLKRQTL